MDETLVGIVGFVLALVVLDLAALRAGHDSRPLRPEPPLGALPPIGPAAPGGPGRGGRRLTVRGPFAEPLRPAVAAPVRLPSPTPKPFAPPVLGDALGYHAFDLAAAGK